MVRHLIQQSLNFYIPSHTWDSNLQYSDPDVMGPVATPGGDQVDDLLTPCAGALRTKSLLYQTNE